MESVSFNNYALNWSKFVVKTLLMLQKVCISHVCLFLLSIHQRMYGKYMMVSTRILSRTTVFNIDDNKKNVFCAPNQHMSIRHYKESCDTEAWLLKIQLCTHNNKLHFKIYSNIIIFLIATIFFLIFTVFLYKCSLGSTRDFKQTSRCINKWQKKCASEHF